MTRLSATFGGIPSAVGEPYGAGVVDRCEGRGAGGQPDCMEAIPARQERAALVLAERLRAEEQPRVQVSKDVDRSSGAYG